MGAQGAVPPHFQAKICVFESVSVNLEVSTPWNCLMVTTIEDHICLLSGPKSGPSQGKP